MIRVTVIAGLSGAGRSQAASHLEDLGWFVVDNIPPALIAKVVELADTSGSGVIGLALVVGRGPYSEEVTEALATLRDLGHEVRIVFLEASTEVLVRRYESTRRRHPVAGDGAGDDLTLAETIERERDLLEPVKALADVVIDTTNLNVHQLRERLVELFAPDVAGGAMQLRVMSFGFKQGVPVDVDLVLDCRFLPNPHWDEALRPLTGRDEAVRRYVLDRPQTQEFLEHLVALLTPLLPAYVAEGKSYLTIALGCTGGRHRSVALAEELARRLDEAGWTPTVRHRDVEV